MEVLRNHEPECALLDDQRPFQPSKQITDRKLSANHLGTLSEPIGIDAEGEVVLMLWVDKISADVGLNNLTGWN